MTISSTMWTMQTRVAGIWLGVVLTAICCGAEPPEGFVALFNGKDLTGWKGLVADPPTRAKMAPEELTKAQAAADQRMREHWSAKDGVLVFDGKGDNICTAEDFSDFELLVDWKILPGGDSGIYLRGNPQVQIWDNADGSGGLYNNKTNISKPLAKADKPVGEWNSFRVLMTGDRVTVFLNGTLVVEKTPMENYFERGSPLPTQGSIELQNHGNVLEFRNIYVRKIKNDSANPLEVTPRPKRQD